MSSSAIHIAILGASGYTGVELVRFLLRHPHASIDFLVADSNAGKRMGDIYPHLSGATLPKLVTIDQVAWDQVDVAFCCLPHGASHQAVAAIPPHIKVIDLSADFRFRDPSTYEAWYHAAHPLPALQQKVAYGLTEHFRDEIKEKHITACPGCYPTSALMPLMPLLKAGVIQIDPIIVDAKSGVSGAGRSLKQTSLFTEVDGGIKPYGITSHRHAGEIEAYATEAAALSGSNKPVLVQFTPQLVPMSRGILSTIYVTLAEPFVAKGVQAIYECWHESYDQEPFVHVIKDQVPSTRDVYGTNDIRLYATGGRAANRVVLVAVIDNLVKGASGQAIQNMNLRFGLDETTGLLAAPLFP